MSRTRACPDCGGRLILIVYGLPGADLQEQGHRGEVVLGGCVVTDDDPQWRCPECGTEFRAGALRSRSPPWSPGSPWGSRLRPQLSLDSPLLLAALACGRGDERANARELRVAVDTAGGFVTVRNLGAPPPRWSLREILTLGASMGVEESALEEFGAIASAVADDGGSIYAGEAQVQEIRVFDEGGQLLRRMGREGGGPGELGALQSLSWLGDTLMVADPRNGRLGLFSPEGEWLGQRRYAAITGPEVGLYPTEAGEVYSASYRVEGGEFDFLFVRQTPRGPADTLLRPRDERAGAFVVRCDHEVGGGISFHRAELAPEPIGVPAPGRTLALGWSADYRIAFVRGGDTLRVAEREGDRRLPRWRRMRRAGEMT